MTRTGRTALALVALAAMFAAPAAFATPQCTHHDRLVQKINAAWQTRFQTSCNAPLDQGVEEVD